MSPRYFIICEHGDIHRMMRDGWTDLITGAEYNGLNIIDQHDSEDSEAWIAMNKLRKASKSPTRVKLITPDKIDESSIVWIG